MYVYRRNIKLIEYYNIHLMDAFYKFLSILRSKYLLMTILLVKILPNYFINEYYLSNLEINIAFQRFDY